MCVTHWRVVFELWCADESDSLCSWSGKLCAPDSFSRSSSVTLRPPPTPRVESDADSLSRHLCPSTSVSVCEGPEAFLLPPHARLAFSHSVRLVPTQRLHGSPVQSLTAAPHHEPSGGVQPHAGGVSHGFQTQLVLSRAESGHPSLRSARSPALSKRVIRVTQERTKPKTVPQKNKPCLLGLTESSSQRNPRPHKPPNQRKNHWTDTISPSSVTCTLRLVIHQRNAMWGFLCDVPRTTLTSSG